MLKKLTVAFIAIAALTLSQVAAMAQEAAGVVEKMRGAAFQRADGATKPLSVGATVHAGDLVTTAEDARLLIRFADQSSLTMGELAQLTIDELVYVPAGREPEKGEQTLKFVKGVFQYVSGKIAHSDTTQVSLNTPVATIGIRGTRLLAGELQVGMPPGQPHYGFQILEGAIDVIAPLGTVTLDEPGEGTFLPLTRQAAPTPVRQWTAEEAAEAADAVRF
ncbi:MAG: FecR domain-containing protein [Rhodospirillales bacterium]